MCPISGIVQLLLTFGIILIFHCWLIRASKSKYNLNLNPNNVTVYMDEKQPIFFNLTGPDIANVDALLLQVKSDYVASADREIILKNEKSGYFNISGDFLGNTTVVFEGKYRNQSVFQVDESLAVIVIRKVRTIDRVFTYSVATLVTIIYINFGCAFNWAYLRTIIKRPVGPAIGYVAQFLFMPLLSFGLARLLFPNDIPIQLGMFFTGVSPSGGASNIWTVLLDGNLELSITMTTISMLAAFAMMPLWMFTLGTTIFDESHYGVPYHKLSTYAFALVLPLLIGFLIQRYLNTVAKFLVRILKIFAAFLIIFIICFATSINLYLFRLFSWQIVVGGIGLPWLGYALAWCFAKSFQQSAKDSLTIAIETGIQNTGIAIFLLRFTLPQPDADLAMIVPIAVDIMTPLPLLGYYIYNKLKKDKHSTLKETPGIDIDNNFQ